MSKYLPLKKFLLASSKTKEELTFRQVEIILNFNLPNSASEHRAWWANDYTHTHAAAWLEADWKVESVEQTKSPKIVVFSKNSNIS